MRAARRFRATAILPDGQTPGDVRTINATPLAEHEVAALLRGAVAAPAALPAGFPEQLRDRFYADWRAR